MVKEFPESDIERFRREARILARLSHPNIPAIYDVDFSPGKFLIVFQFIEGRTLKQLLEQDGPCQLTDARKWFHQISSALDHAHSFTIVHRDIKPANIIITEDREVAYLVDFGIALSADDAKKLTKSGFAIGTPGYMSPEQQSGDLVDRRSDIYSLGVTLYEALAGNPIPLGQYRELSVSNEAIPPQVDDLIRDCLLPKARRVDSAKSFSERLAGSMRTLKPLSDVLVQGRLHEVASAIEELNAEEFINLPAGQRALILAKLAEITGSQLEAASVELLDLLLARGILLPKEDYREIVKLAIEWGFAKRFKTGSIGSDPLRRALAKAASQARSPAHEVLREELAAFLNEHNLDDENDLGWFLHSIRQVLQTLLANPNCLTGATELARTLKSVVSLQRSRPA